MGERDEKVETNEKANFLFGESTYEFVEIETYEITNV